MITKEYDNEVGVNDFADSTQLYYQDLKRHKAMPREEERKLLVKAKQGDIEARNKILTANLRFVFKIAKKYRNRGVDISDLINEGNDGMLHAIEKFDITQDVKFFSYAVWWIRQRMLAAIKQHEDETARQESFDEVFQCYESNHYDNLYSEDDEDTYGNDIEDKTKAPIEDDEEDEQKRIAVEHLLVKLDDRERAVIEKWFGINQDEEESLIEISQELNICTERVRQLKARAINKMRAEVFDIKEAQFLFR